MRSTLLFAGLCATILAAGCMNPRDQADIITALNSAANELNDLKDSFSSLQATVDSLQGVVAQQDTTIARLKAFVNMPGAPNLPYGAGIPGGTGAPAPVPPPHH